MRIEEANSLQDNINDLSVNSSKVTLTEIFMPTNREKFKYKGKKKQKRSYPKQQNRYYNKIQKPKWLYYVYGKPRHKAY